MYRQHQKAEDIFQVVSCYSGYGERILKGKSRVREIVIFRQLFTYFALKKTNHSVRRQEIADIIGKHRATTYHSFRNIQGLIKYQNPQVMKPYLKLSEFFDIN